MASPYRVPPAKEKERKLPWLCRWWRHEWIEVGIEEVDDSLENIYKYDLIMWARCKRCERVEWFRLDDWYAHQEGLRHEPADLRRAPAEGTQD